VSFRQGGKLLSADAGRALGGRRGYMLSCGECAAGGGLSCALAFHLVGSFGSFVSTAR
jgi:hypothetical protein